MANDFADDIENQGFEVLENIVQDLFKGFFHWDCGLPERRVICNECASYHGMAKCFKKKNPKYNDSGIAIRYDIDKIYLKKSILSKNGYYDAIATYVHELCHVFGGDSSNAFSQGLTFALEKLLSNPKIIEKYRQKWNLIFEGSGPGNRH